MAEERPKVAETPLELLSNIPEREIPFLNKHWGITIGSATGFFSVLYSNWGSKRPIFSGAPRHVLFTIAGGALGYYVDAYRSQYLADRDAGLRHYVELHPEDFPPFKRQKYGEILEPWVPIRGM